MTAKKDSAGSRIEKHRRTLTCMPSLLLAQKVKQLVKSFSFSRIFPLKRLLWPEEPLGGCVSFSVTMVSFKRDQSAKPVRAMQVAVADNKGIISSSEIRPVALPGRAHQQHASKRMHSYVPSLNLGGQPGLAGTAVSHLQLAISHEPVRLLSVPSV